jgi:HK97 family phage major capsid protein
MFPALKEATDRLAALQKQMKDVFDEAGPDLDMDKIKSIQGDSAAKIEWIRAKNAEIDDAGKDVDGLQAVEAAAAKVKGMPRQRANGSGPDADGDADGDRDGRKSFGRRLVESKACTTHRGRDVEIPVDLKTLFQTTDGWAPEVTRTGTVIYSAQRPIQVTDLIPQTITGQAAVAYMEETTFTNAAAERAEGGAYGESELDLTERSSTVRSVATFLPVTDEQFEDEARAEAYVNNRLPFMIRQRLDGQILTGNGTPPNLRGVNNVAGIQTQAKGTDPVPDAVYKAMTKVRVTGRAMPSAVVCHPNDWQDIRLLRTADGIYIWGNPSDAGPDRIWGRQVVESDAQTENTAVVGDWINFSELAVRKGIEVKMSDSHSDYFVNGKMAIRARIRVALIFYRPAAFCTVTGI